MSYPKKGDIFIEHSYDKKKVYVYFFLEEFLEEKNVIAEYREQYRLFCLNDRGRNIRVPCVILNDSLLGWNKL